MFFFFKTIPSDQRRRTLTQFHIFRFPANNSKAILWANAIGWMDFASISRKRICYICQDHFEQSCYFSKDDKRGILRLDAVPTLLLNRQPIITDKVIIIHRN
jgi:hypothetical protein